MLIIPAKLIGYQQGRDVFSQELVFNKTNNLQAEELRWWSQLYWHCHGPAWRKSDMLREYYALFSCWTEQLVKWLAEYLSVSSLLCAMLVSPAS